MVRAGDYVELSKPRIGLLVLIAVGVSYSVACWGRPDLWVTFSLLAGTLLVAGSASALNQWLEWQRDARMPRTANRPLPARRVKTREATAFAGITLLAGASCLMVSAGWKTLAWALLAWLLYVAVYTPLKVRTPLNTIFGALAGAMPVWIGWSASGRPFDLQSASLYSILFLWQFPHFMAIAWLYRKQYEAAGMRMLSVVDPTGRGAAMQALSASLTLVPVSVVPAFFLPSLSGIVYSITAAALGSGQVAVATAFWLRRSDQAAQRMLRVSLIYLPVVLLLLLLMPWS
jgi:protoheme IX farnesyltransferase